MDGRTTELLDLPDDMISHEICKWLSLEALLKLCQTNQWLNQCVDTFIQLKLPKIPLRQLLNRDDGHFIFLCNLIKKNPALLQPLRNPEKLLILCLQLKPIGLLRLSIIFSSFVNELYLPLRAVANSESQDWPFAFICCALFTPDINTINTFILTQTIQSLALPENKEDYAAIHLCLCAIDRVIHTHNPIDISDFPYLIPCYLNLQGARLPSARLQCFNPRFANLLSFANLRGADLSSSELQHRKLYGAYIKGANFRGSHLWGAFFFDLSDSTATLQNQLDMLDCQLSKSEETARLDEALTTDLLTQISAISNPTERRRALETAHTHHLFQSRLDNHNIQIAFHKAFRTVTKPSTTGLFTLPKLRHVSGATATPTLPSPSPRNSQ